MDKVKGEPVYLILAMDAGQGAAPEAAESRHRPADPASGGGHMSGAPLVTHPGRRRGRAAQGGEPMDRLHLAADRGAGRRAGHAAVDRARRRWRARDVLRRAGDGRTASHRDRELSRQSRTRLAGLVGGAARNRRRAALRALSRHRRSGRGRGHDRGRQQHRRAGADAGHGARRGCGFRRRAPCRGGVRQAQARPRRPGVARTPRRRQRKDER